MTQTVAPTVATAQSSPKPIFKLEPLKVASKANTANEACVCICACF